MGRLALDGLIGIDTNLSHAGARRCRGLERVAAHGRRTCRPRRARRIPCDRRGVLRGAGDAPGDDWLRPPGFTHRAGSVDHRSRYRQLPKDRPRFVDGQPSGNLTREHIVDNITLYRWPAPRASAARSYWGEGQEMLVRHARLPRRSRFQSASRRSPGRSGGPRAAGSRRRTPTSSTSTRWTRAVTSPLGRTRALLGKLRAAFRPLRWPTLVS